MGTAGKEKVGQAESSSETRAIPCVKQMVNGKLLWNARSAAECSAGWGAGRGHAYTCGWFTSMGGRNQYNFVIILQLKVNTLKKKNSSNKITKHYFALYCHRSMEILNIINHEVFSFRGTSCYPLNTPHPHHFQCTLLLGNRITGRNNVDISSSHEIMKILTHDLSILNLISMAWEYIVLPALFKIM